MTLRGGGGGGGGSGLSVIMTLTVGKTICESPLTPSGRFPSDLRRPVGSSLEGI